MAINSSTPSPRAGFTEADLTIRGLPWQLLLCNLLCQTFVQHPCNLSFYIFVLTWEKRHLIFFLLHPWGLINTQTEKLWPNLLPHARDVYILWSPKTRLNCFGDTSANVRHTLTFKMATQTVIKPSLSLQWKKTRHNCSLLVNYVIPFTCIYTIAVMQDVTQRFCGIF